MFQKRAGMTDIELNNSRILIVDDQESNVLLLEQMLEEAGYMNIYSVTDSRKASDRYKALKPHLVLLDLNMPHLDGFEVMAQLKGVEKDSFLPVLILTAQKDHRARLRALKEGAKDFLTKPFDIQEALFRIRNLLEMRLLHNQVKDQNILLEKKVAKRTEELVNINLKLERQREEMNDFLNIAAHDLQEPLRKIMIFNDLLQEKHGSFLDEEGRGYLNRLSEMSMRMRDLLHDLSSFQRIVSRQPHYQSLDLRKEIAYVLEQFEGQLEEIGGNAELDHLPEIEGDREQVRLMFQCIISNSIKFRSDDHALSIKISSREGNRGGHDILVEDNGIGFDEKYLDRIFRPFEKLHGRSKYEGNGIGLALCRKIADNHRDMISAESIPDKGTTIIVSLPEGHIKEVQVKTV